MKCHSILKILDDKDMFKRVAYGLYFRYCPPTDYDILMWIKMNNGQFGCFIWKNKAKAKKMN